MNNIFSSTVFSILFLFLFTTTQAQTDTLWFDFDWNTAPKEEASYFRPPPKKKKNIYLINDFYVNGDLQMEGFSTTQTEPFHFDGDVTWYYYKGGVKEKLSYENNVPIKAIFFMENGEIQGVYEYENGEQIKYIGYDYTSDNGVVTSSGPFYVIHFKDGLLNGRSNMIDFSTKDTLYTGNYKDGIMQDFEFYLKKYDKFRIGFNNTESKEAKIIAKKYGLSKNELKDFLYPKAKKIGKLENGIETWEQYVGDILCATQSFKDGQPYGKWEVFNIYTGELEAVLNYGDYCANKNDSIRIFDSEIALPNYYLYTGNLTNEACLHGEYILFEEGVEIIKGRYEKGKRVGDWYFKYEYDEDFFDPNPSIEIGYNRNYDDQVEDVKDATENESYEIIDVVEED